MPRYSVAYEITFLGFTTVEAETAEEARELVDDGEFAPSPTQERSDWKSIGPGTLVVGE